MVSADNIISDLYSSGKRVIFTIDEGVLAKQLLQKNQQKKTKKQMNITNKYTIILN